MTARTTDASDDELVRGAHLAALVHRMDVAGAARTMVAVNAVKGAYGESPAGVALRLEVLVTGLLTAVDPAGTA